MPSALSCEDSKLVVGSSGKQHNHQSSTSSGLLVESRRPRDSVILHKLIDVERCRAGLVKLWPNLISVATRLQYSIGKYRHDFPQPTRLFSTCTHVHQDIQGESRPQACRVGGGAFNCAAWMKVAKVGWKGRRRRKGLGSESGLCHHRSTAFTN